MIPYILKTEIKMSKTYPVEEKNKKQKQPKQQKKLNYTKQRKATWLMTLQLQNVLREDISDMIQNTLLS